MQDARRRPVRLVAAALAAVAAILAPTTAGHAEPDRSISQVRQQVDALEHKAEQAAERYNTVRERVREQRRRLAAAEAGVARQERRLAAATRAMGGYAAALYRGTSIDPTLQALLAADPDEVLRDTALADAYASQQVAALKAIARERQLLAERRADAAAVLDRISALERQLAAERRELDTRVAETEELLDSLEAEERARLEAARRAAAQSASRSASRPALRDVARDVAVSGRAGAAVDFALAQVGDAYVYGAAGPDAWDCSGLTMQAWAAAGVSLPHSSSMQYSSGTRVAVSDMQPGDLVFYYSPISHVGLYIGNGQLVHAANPSRPVHVVPVDSMPITGVVRPG